MAALSICRIAQGITRTATAYHYASSVLRRLREMSLRCRGSIKVLPGIRLNVGKRGVSTSIGVRGAHVTLGHGKVRETVGIPGTGLSYTHVSTPHQAAADAPGAAQPSAVTDVLPKGRAWRGWLWIALGMSALAWIAWTANT
jgi:hypothetical protein